LGYSISHQSHRDYPWFEMLRPTNDQHQQFIAAAKASPAAKQLEVYSGSKLPIL
jgi:hypothetical protein